MVVSYIKKINLGCGRDDIRPREEGWINVDWLPFLGVDQVFDLNKFPYPFVGCSVDRIRMIHVLEHLDDPYRVILECHRILKPNGILEIVVPHVDNKRMAYMLQHKHFFTEHSFKPLYSDNLSSLDCEKMFNLVSLDIVRPIRRLFRKIVIKIVLKKEGDKI